jgi:hypothetical protein
VLVSPPHRRTRTTSATPTPLCRPQPACGAANADDLSNSKHNLVAPQDTISRQASNLRNGCWLAIFLMSAGEQTATRRRRRLFVFTWNPSRASRRAPLLPRWHRLNGAALSHSADRPSHEIPDDIGARTAPMLPRVLGAPPSSWQPIGADRDVGPALRQQSVAIGGRAFSTGHR